MDSKRGVVNAPRFFVAYINHKIYHITDEVPVN